MNAPVLIAWGFERPWAGLLLALPVALVLLARRRDRPRPWYTGAFELWLAVAARAPEASRSPRRRTPPEAWLFAAGLASAVAALAGPRPDGGTPAWTVVVDRSPSMYLPAEGGTRLERALALLAQNGFTGEEERTWIDAAVEPPVIARANAFPAAWRAPPARTRRELDGAAHDAPGTIVLTDREAGVQFRSASLCAGGGASVPGLVAVDASGAWVWDGTRLAEEPVAGRAARVRMRGAHAREIERFVEVWCAARGHALEPGGDGPAELVLTARAVRGNPRVFGRFGRDGWTASGAGAEVLEEPGAPEGPEARGETDGPGGLATWLALDTGAPLVQNGPGRVVLAWTGEQGFDLERGSDAAFAVSFGALLDACIEPPPGVVSLDERAAAGAPVWRGGAEPVPTGTGRAVAARWQAALAILALVLVVGALAIAGLVRGA